MSDFRPIPIPIRHRWREIRIQGIPVLVFLMALAAVVFLWDRELRPSVLSGEVYAVVSHVNAPGSGTMESLSVRPFQRVEAGEVVATVAQVPEARVTAALAVLQAEIELTRQGAADPVLDQHRNLLNWQSLRQDSLEARTRLASLQVRARQAGREYERVRALHANNQVPAIEYDRAHAEHEALTAEAEALQLVVEEFSRALAAAPHDADDLTRPMASAIAATMDWQEKRLRQLELDLSPLEVRAPIAGVVTLLHTQPGAHVMEGALLFEIRAEEADHIIGYLREPVVFEPREGMKVEVAQRGSSRARAEAEILRIGPQFEALGPAFQQPFVQREERAIPLLISLPGNLRLRPGELVDLRLIDTN